MTRAIKYNGEVLSRVNCLAPVNRWLPWFKGRVCQGICTGIVSFDEAMAAHDLSAQELTSWLGHFREHGEYGLADRNIAKLRRAAA